MLCHLSDLLSRIPMMGVGRQGCPLASCSSIPSPPLLVASPNESYLFVLNAVSSFWSSIKDTNRKQTIIKASTVTEWALLHMRHKKLSKVRILVWIHSCKKYTECRGISRRSQTGGGKVSHYFWRPGAKLKDGTFTTPSLAVNLVPLKFSTLEPLQGAPACAMAPYSSCKFIFFCLLFPFFPSFFLGHSQSFLIIIKIWKHL